MPEGGVGLEGAAPRKRIVRALLVVVISVAMIVSVVSLLVLSQPSGEPAPYVLSFRWMNLKIGPECNTSYALVEGTIVNSRITQVNNITLALDVYVNYVCHHDGHLTLLKRECVSFGDLPGTTNKSFSLEIQYQKDPFYSFRCVDYELFWTL